MYVAYRFNLKTVSFYRMDVMQRYMIFYAYLQFFQDVTVRDILRINMRIFQKLLLPTIEL